MTGRISFTIHIDGAARGNPGPAAFAYVIAHDGETVLEEAGKLGVATNNCAEYTALVRALERAAELGAKEVYIRSDSELLVKQMNGQYQVKNAQLKALFTQAKKLSDHFDTVRLLHVPRAQNSEADRLCNEVLDGLRDHMQPLPAVPKLAPVEKLEKLGIHEEAVAFLREAATSWSAGNPTDPLPEEVWKSLWAILSARKVVCEENR